MAHDRRCSACSLTCAYAMCRASMVVILTCAVWHGARSAVAAPARCCGPGGSDTSIRAHVGRHYRLEGPKRSTKRDTCIRDTVS